MITSTAPRAMKPLCINACWRLTARNAPTAGTLTRRTTAISSRTCATTSSPQAAPASWPICCMSCAGWRAKNEAGLTFDLTEDFRDALEALHADDSRGKTLRLLDEALRRDIHFIARHAADYPQGLFQCMWNTCWWYDCPEAAGHYEEKRTPGQAAGVGLHRLLEVWRAEKEKAKPGFVWVRSLRPPEIHLGSAQRMVFTGHEGHVESVAYSPDGTRIVSGSHDQTVRVWDANHGHQILCLTGHGQSVNSASYSPDGLRIVSGGHDGTVRVWDAFSGQKLLCMTGHGDWVNSVSYAPDGSRIVSGGHKGTVLVWDARNGNQLLCLSQNRDTIRQVTFSPDGTRVVCGSDSGVCIWDARSGQGLLDITHLAVISVSFSPDGSRIVGGLYDSRAIVWDAQSGQEIFCLTGHRCPVSSVSFSPDGSRIVSGCGAYYPAIRVWDVSSGQQIHCLKGHSSHSMSGVMMPYLSVSYSLDGSHIVSGGSDGTIRVWNADGGQPLLSLLGHSLMVWKLAYSPDGSRMASGSSDGTVRVWDVYSGRHLFCLTTEQWEIDWSSSLHYSPDGERLVSRTKGTVRVWDAHSGNLLEVLTSVPENLAASVADSQTLSWLATTHPLETLIETADAIVPIAWFPATLYVIWPHLAGRTWAGSGSNHIYLFTLQGTPPTADPTGPSPRTTC